MFITPKALFISFGITQVLLQLERCKGVIVEEPEATADFKAAKLRYENAIKGPAGKRDGSAVLLAVYRGKMSEARRSSFFL